MGGGRGMGRGKGGGGREGRGDRGEEGWGEVRGGGDKGRGSIIHICVPLGVLPLASAVHLIVQASNSCTVTTCV